MDWLLPFVKSDAAWRISQELLASSRSQQVQFYAANTLCSKVQQGLRAMAPDARTALTSCLTAYIAQPQRFPPVVLKRLCLARAAAAVLSGPGGARACVEGCLALASGATPRPWPSRSCRGVYPGRGHI